MGKAKIIENKGAGLYRVEMLLKGGNGQNVDAWCADYTDDLSVGQIVGTIEIDGVGVSLVKPGFEDPSWSASDGELADPEKASPSGFFWNAALLPAWQKFRPTAREGTIISIDREAGTASVCLKPATGPLGIPLEPDDLPECDLYDEPEIDDPNIAQLDDFCERHPDHPACHPVTERTTISYAAFWEDIVQVNTMVNQGLTYARDVGGDVWDVVSLPGTGDCEDYALTKMQMLAARGVPASAMGLAVGKIGSGPVRGAGDADHAWAVVFTDRGMFHLDQAPNIPRQSRPAQNTRILRYQQDYDILARRLDDVPIEYMDCDAGAFEVGDEVLVRFAGQDWTTPVVAGFARSPRQCPLLLACGTTGSSWGPPQIRLVDVRDMTEVGAYQHGSGVNILRIRFALSGRLYYCTPEGVYELDIRTMTLAAAWLPGPGLMISDFAVGVDGHVYAGVSDFLGKNGAVVRLDAGLNSTAAFKEDLGGHANDSWIVSVVACGVDGNVYANGGAFWTGAGTPTILRREHLIRISPTMTKTGALVGDASFVTTAPLIFGLDGYAYCRGPSSANVNAIARVSPGMSVIAELPPVASNSWTGLGYGRDGHLYAAGTNAGILKISRQSMAVSGEYGIHLRSRDIVHGPDGRLFVHAARGDFERTIHALDPETMFSLRTYTMQNYGTRRINTLDVDGALASALHEWES